MLFLPAPPSVNAWLMAAIWVRTLAVIPSKAGIQGAENAVGTRPRGNATGDCCEREMSARANRFAFPPADGEGSQR